MFLLQAENEVIEIGLDPSELTTDVVYALENIERCLERVFAGPEKKPSSVYNFNSKLVENLFVEPPKNGAEVHLSFGNKRQIEPRYIVTWRRIYLLFIIIGVFIVILNITMRYRKYMTLTRTTASLSTHSLFVSLKSFLKSLIILFRWRVRLAMIMTNLSNSQMFAATYPQRKKLSMSGILQYRNYAIPTYHQ
jgi:hypothetical protein